MSVESVTLYFREGGSDKVYQANLEQVAGGYSVNFAYGKRGSTLKTGQKTNSPVSMVEAKKIYDKLVSEKMSKGYAPGSDEVSTYVPAETTSAVINAVQLLEAIDAESAERYLTSSTYWAQEKKDGERKVLQKIEGAVSATNRKGKYCGFPLVFQEALLKVPFDVVLDGESVGEIFFAFDILSLKGEDVTKLPYSERYAALESINSSFGANGVIQVVTTAKNEDEKRKLLNTLKEQGKEGIVFKNVTATYSPGRAASGNSQFKLKFWESCSAVVAEVNNKRSVYLSLLDENSNTVGVGNVTIPPNQDIPQEGQIVEVRYLYAYKGGSLYQPTYLGVREDIDTNECLISQLKFKA